MDRKKMITKYRNNFNEALGISAKRGIELAEIAWKHKDKAKTKTKLIELIWNDESLTDIECAFLIYTLGGYDEIMSPTKIFAKTDDSDMTFEVK